MDTYFNHKTFEIGDKVFVGGIVYSKTDKASISVDGLYNIEKVLHPTIPATILFPKGHPYLTYDLQKYLVVEHGNVIKGIIAGWTHKAIGFLEFHDYGTIFKERERFYGWNVLLENPGSRFLKPVFCFESSLLRQE